MTFNILDGLMSATSRVKIVHRNCPHCRASVDIAAAQLGLLHSALINGA